MQYILAEKYKGHFRPIEIAVKTEDIFEGLEYGDVYEGEYQIWEYPSGNILQVKPDRKVPDSNYYSPPSSGLWNPRLIRIGRDKRMVAEAYGKYKHIEVKGMIRPSGTIPVWKFLLLSIITFGLYQLYWGWKSWSILAKIENKKYFTATQGFFVPFTSLMLFPRLLKLAKNQGYRSRIDGQGLALSFLIANVVLYLPSPVFLNQNIEWLIFGLSATAIVISPLPIVMATNFYLANTDEQVMPTRRNWKLIIIIILFAIISSIFSYYVYV